MNIVILAAGLGKRMRSHLPKVMHPVAGRPMLAHVIATAQACARGRAGAARIVIVIGHGAAAVRAAFADRSELLWAVQEPQLGTGHAALQAAPLLDEAHPTLVLYGDVPLVRNDTLVQLIDAAEQGVSVLTVRVADPTGYGRVIREGDGSVARIVEQKDAQGTELRVDEVNTGILVAPTASLKRWLARLSNQNAQREYYLTDVVAQAVAEAVPVVGVPCLDAEETLGVNSKEQLAQVERIAQRRSASALMEAGATLADPGRTEVRGEVSVGRDVTIDVGCVFEGHVELGDEVRIGPYTVLRDCVIGAGTEVLGFSHLDSATIGRGARIGPFARTRPDVVLGDEVHIGNFVEVKNSQLGQGAKANHLAYVGDADVGRRVNIGAGTIIANYDGAFKHKTVIGDDAHMGSNSVLVAPITVGAGATVGAGSTVAGNVPAGKLTVARARQSTVEGWVRPTRKK